MYLLPLFKSLMQEVRTHMTERERKKGREGGSEPICVLCGGMKILVLLCSNKGFHGNRMHH